MPLTQTGRLLTVTTSAGADAFVLTGFSGREELSRPFSFGLDLASDDATHKPADFLGKPIAWQVNDPDDAPRLFHGLVRSFRAGPVVGRGIRRYSAEVVSWTWFLSQATNCKTFQDKSATDIVTASLLGFADFKLQLSATPPVRPYCVQYRESHLDFVSRLLEDEGIFTLFEYAADKHTLVMADAPSAYVACDPHATVEYRPEAGGNATPVISGWERGATFHSGKAATTDFDFAAPTISLLATTDTVSAVAMMKQYEAFDYPGNHVAAARGTALVKVRIEEAEAGEDLAEGDSGCTSFRPGAKFTLAGHPADDGEYVLVSVDHSASDPAIPGVVQGTSGYGNRFTCAPAAVPVRPRRLTPKPRTSGPITALVVGPSGEEIHTDEYGRVKLKFPWDREAKADGTDSIWVRVSEPWAGAGWGAQFLPRVGQEVVVDFLHGDPDRPLVTGRVANADNPRPYKLPDTKTQSGIKSKSTPNGGAEDFSEIRFEDKKGEEDFVVHAQKDFHRSVENDDDLTVGHDQTVEVKNARTVTVKEADDKLTVEKGARTVTVSEGKHTLDVTKGDRVVTVGQGNDTHTVKQGNRTVEVSQGNNELTVKVGNSTTTVHGNDALAVKQGNREVVVELGNDTLTVKVGNQTTKVSVGASTTEAMQGITLKCGPSEIKLAPEGVSIKGLTVKVEGTVQTSIKGLITEVSADAMLKLKGGVTMIN